MMSHGTGGLGAASRECFRQMQTLGNNSTAQLSSASETVETPLHDCLARFKIWAGNIGAFQEREDETSLEHRLRAAPKLESKFHELLDLLQDNLTEFQTIASGHKANRSATVPLSLPGDGAPHEIRIVVESEELVRAIHENITALLRLSSLARKATSRDRYKLAQTRVSDSGLDVTEEQDIEAVSHQFPRLRDPSLQWLRERLGKANNARRKFLVYSSDHQERILAASRLAIDDSRPGQLAALTKTGNDEWDASSFVAGTTASTAVAANVRRVDTNDDGAETESVGSYVSYARDMDPGSTLKVVDLEEMRMCQETFQCPYCKIDQSYTRQKPWCKHVYRDLRAYVCTAESCELRMFETSDSWIRHETRDHLTQWQCPHCAESPFESLTRFERHMRDRHRSKFHDHQLTQLAKACESAPDNVPAIACRFCNWEEYIRSSDSAARHRRDIRVPLSRYRKHVGFHLEQQALAVITATEHSDASDGSKTDHEGSQLTQAESVEAVSAIGPSSSRTNGYRSHIWPDGPHDVGDHLSVDEGDGNNDRPTSLSSHQRAEHAALLRSVLRLPRPITNTYFSSPNLDGYVSTPDDIPKLPWPSLEIMVDLTCEGQAMTPEVHAQVEKGFFLSTVDQRWTCYRRSYFSVACQFELHPHINNGRIYLMRNNKQEQIWAMGMRLAAVVAGSGGKDVDLFQHLPKKDGGSKSKIDVAKVSPRPTPSGEETVAAYGTYEIPVQTSHPVTGPGPYLPLQGHASDKTIMQTTQNSASSSHAPSHLPVPALYTTHTFKRVQFKQATANNGKRRASQQYFHLLVELYGDVRKEGSDSAVWVKIAQRVSEKVVVRGRSPSHYQVQQSASVIDNSGSRHGEPSATDKFLQRLETESV